LQNVNITKYDKHVSGTEWRVEIIVPVFCRLLLQTFQKENLKMTYATYRKISESCNFFWIAV